MLSVSLLLLTNGHSARQSALPVLTAHGFDIVHQEFDSFSFSHTPKVTAVILDMALGDFYQKIKSIRTTIPKPVLWWCDRTTPDLDLLRNADVDGILTPDMSETDMIWSLYFCCIQHAKLLRYIQENEQLLLRLEDRKWIDQAKSILCKLKKVSEQEAYEVLRKQAMNERKKMVDVAKSIVTVYRLMHE